MSVMSDERSNPIRQVGQALQGFLRSAGLLDESREALCAILWPRLAGDWYARHTRVVSLRGSTLYVRCESAPRAQQLQLDAPAIIARLNEALGESVVTEIRPSSAGVGRELMDAAPAEPEGPPTPTEEELAAIRVPPERIREILELVGDLEGEMREHLERLLLAQARLDIWRGEHGFVQCPGCGAWHLDSGQYCLSCRPPERPTMAGGEDGLSAFFDEY